MKERACDLQETTNLRPLLGERTVQSHSERMMKGAALRVTHAVVSLLTVRHASAVSRIDLLRPQQNHQLDMDVVGS
jgi:hypothetical protein